MNKLGRKRETNLWTVSFPDPSSFLIDIITAGPDPIAEVELLLGVVTWSEEELSRSRDLHHFSFVSDLVEMSVSLNITSQDGGLMPESSRVQTDMNRRHTVITRHGERRRGPGFYCIWVILYILSFDWANDVEDKQGDYWLICVLLICLATLYCAPWQDEVPPSRRPPWLLARRGGFQTRCTCLGSHTRKGGSCTWRYRPSVLEKMG